MSTEVSDLNERFSCRKVEPQRRVRSLAEDARDGLLLSPRSLPPKYFYDTRGSELFDRICDTPEYYVTRVEEGLLKQYAADIIAHSRPRHLIEFGSGAARKTGHLLAACELTGLPCVYWPFDVCEAMLHSSALVMLQSFPWLRVHALLGDYTAGLAALPAPDGPVLYAFLGSSIGNYTEAQAIDLLAELRQRMQPADWFLLGADRVKAPLLLHAAYNDEQGITAAFNRNLLQVLNRTLGADFDESEFGHRAFYDSALRQIEMHLVAQRAQSVHIAALGRTIEMAQGETILTEISRKYSPQDLSAMLARAGFVPVAHYEPADGVFSLMLAAPAAQ